MNSKVIFSGVLILALLATGIYFIYDASAERVDPWKGIPKDAALVLEMDDPHELFSKLSDNNELWEGVRLNKQTSGISGVVLLIDTLQMSLPEKTADEEHPLILVIQPGNKLASLHFLLISNGHPEGSLEKMKALLDEMDDYKISTTGNNSFQLTGPSGSKYYFTHARGLVAVSNAKTMAEEFVKNLSAKGPSLAENASLIRLRSYAGSHVDGRLYVQYKFLSKILADIGHESFQSSIAWLSKFADWSETDLILKKDELIMTGFTLADPNESPFLSYFSADEPVRHTVFNVLPFNTNELLVMGRTSFNGYPAPERIQQASKKLGTDLSRIFGLIQGEVALAANASRMSGIENNSWFFMQSDDPDELFDFFAGISKSSGSGKVSDHEGYRIFKIDAKDFIPDIFGEAFSVIQKNYFTLIEEFVVFANSRESLINLTRMYETGKTLDLNENFKVLSDNIGESSNLLLYLKPLELKDLLAKSLQPEYKTRVEDNNQLIRSLLGLAFQYSADDKLTYTSFYLKGSKSYKEENLAVWKLALDDEITGRPTLVRDHNTGQDNMVVFDQAKNIYLVSTDGQVLWKKRVDALPESEIFEVDYYRNGKIQYLFNTRDFIYLLDKNGENVESYPRKINPSATNGLNLFDYSNKRDYRMMIALSDKRIYNYKLDGSQVKGWAKPRTNDIVLEPVQRLVADGKDYIIINDANNDLTIVNRRGNVRIKLKQDPERAKYSDFYVNKTNSKGIILSTDIRGKLFYISTNGSIQYTDFGDFSPSHFFLYEDFNGDGSIDFIYLDGNELTVFDRFKNVLFTYQFESPISIRPEFFRLSGNSRVLGVVADEEKTIYLFDNKGNTLISKGLVGETPFTVGSLQQNGDLNLITAAGTTLFNYRID